MGGRSVEEGERILSASGIPTFAYPDAAARAFDYMWRYSDNLRALYETPNVAEDVENSTAARATVEKMLDKVRDKRRTLLTEFESKQILTSYGISTVDTRIARSEGAAVQFARALGFPVVLKLHSETITHKTDVGGVQLNLPDEDSVRKAYKAIECSVRDKAGAGHFLGVTVQPMVKPDGYELILGSSVDPQFGPVLLFGSGGQLVEVYRDRALGLPPLTGTLALRLMERTHIFKALRGIRGRPPIDLLQLQRVLVRFSHLVVEQPWIKEIDINPLLASARGVLALDARVVLHDPETPLEKLTRPAIRPYPSQYISRWRMKAGPEVVIRPIRPEDEPLLVKFHESLSEESVYLRYFHMAQLSTRIAHERLLRKCFIDYDREMALVAESTASQWAECLHPRSCPPLATAVLRGSRTCGSGDGQVPTSRLGQRADSKTCGDRADRKNKASGCRVSLGKQRHPPPCAAWRRHRSTHARSDLLSRLLGSLEGPSIP